MDTLTMHRRFTHVGFEPEQADALTEVIVSAVTGEVATKADLKGLAVTTASEMDPLRRDVKGLRSDFKVLRKDVDTLRTDVNELRKDVDTLRTDVNELRKDVDTLRKDVDTLRADFTILRKDVDTLGKDVNELRTDFKEFRTEMRTGIDELKDLIGKERQEYGRIGDQDDTPVLQNRRRTGGLSGPLVDHPADLRMMGLKAMKDRLMRRLRKWAFGNPEPLGSPDWRRPEDYEAGEMIEKAMTRCALFLAAWMTLLILIVHFDQ